MEKVRVESMAAEGKCIARVENQVIFIPQVAPMTSEFIYWVSSFTNTSVRRCTAMPMPFWNRMVSSTEKLMIAADVGMRCLDQDSQDERINRIKLL